MTFCLWVGIFLFPFFFMRRHPYIPLHLDMNFALVYNNSTNRAPLETVEQIRMVGARGLEGGGGGGGDRCSH